MYLWELASTGTFGNTSLKLFDLFEQAIMVKCHMYKKLQEFGI